MKKSKIFIIAELSANHNNDFNLALKTIDAMMKSGADAVKIQTFKPESLTLDASTEYFSPKKEGLWKGYTPYQLFSEGAMPYDWMPKLKKHTEELGMVFFSSPFDFEAVDFLEQMNVEIYKIASPEINDIPLIRYVAEKKKPIIISTGMAELSDIELAVKTCKNVGNDNITLLKCTSEYPAPFNMANLKTIPNLKETFNVNVGVSDHTYGSTVPVVSVALGATVVEKHFILDRKLGGIDSAFSMEPHEFAQMVNSVREAEESLGEIDYSLSEKNKLRRRSLFIVNDVKQGEEISTENIRSIRPGNGLSPFFYENIIGKKFKKDLVKGTPLSWDLID